MTISPWPSGQTQPLAAALREDDGSVANVGSTPSFALRIRNVQSGVTTIGAGSFGALDVPSGTVAYTWGVADPVSTPGLYDLSVAVILANGVERIFGPVRWQVVAD